MCIFASCQCANYVCVSYADYACVSYAGVDEAHVACVSFAIEAVWCLP